MVKSVGILTPKPFTMRRPDTTGALASAQSTNIFASSNVSVPIGIFGGSGGSAETSGSCACGSGSSGGGSTIAVG